jgi:four helix bundle protein
LHSVPLMNRLRHHNVVAWQRADALFFRVHFLVLTRLPSHERYVLSAQLRRAALSVPTNIVEGLARRTIPDQVHFLRTAWGSLLEADYLLSVAQRLNYFTRTEYEDVDMLVRKTASALLGLMKSYG